MKNDFDDFGAFGGLDASTPSPLCDRKIMRNARAANPTQPREHRQVVFALATMAAVAAAALLYLLFGPGLAENTQERLLPHFAADEHPQGATGTTKTPAVDPLESYGTSRELMASVIRARYEAAFKKEITEEQLAKALEVMHKYLEKGLRDAVSQVGITSNTLGNRATPSMASPNALTSATNVVPILRVGFTKDNTVQLDGKASSFEEISGHLKKMSPKQTANLRIMVRCEGKAPADLIAKFLEVIDEAGVAASSITISTMGK